MKHCKCENTNWELFCFFFLSINTGKLRLNNKKKHTVIVFYFSLPSLLLLHQCLFKLFSHCCFCCFFCLISKHVSFLWNHWFMKKFNKKKTEKHKIIKRWTYFHTSYKEYGFENYQKKKKNDSMSVDGAALYHWYDKQLNTTNWAVSFCFKTMVSFC